MLPTATARETDQLHTTITYMCDFVRAHVGRQPRRLVNQLEATVVDRLASVRLAMGTSLSRAMGTICAMASEWE
jgi:dihydroneopterin aldolase